MKKKILSMISFLVVVTMITGMFGELAMNRPVKAQAAETVTILNDGYFYGEELRGDTVKFVVEATGSSLTYQWQMSVLKDGGYENISGATSATYSFEPSAMETNGIWFRCCVGGTKYTEPLRLLAASSYGSTAVDGSSIDPFAVQGGNWYLTNGAMAYTVSLSEGIFDVVGLYSGDGNGKRWIETSYDGYWNFATSSSSTPSKTQESSNSLKSAKLTFDKVNPVTVKFAITIADDQHAFAFGCDTQLATVDACYLGASLDNSGKLKQIQMIASDTFDDATDDTAAFVIVPINAESHYWIGHYSNRNYWAVNGEYETADYVNANGERKTATVTVEKQPGNEYGVDSGMTMSWNNLESGTTIKFQFNVGSVADTGAKAAAAEAQVSATSLTVKNTDPEYYYCLFEKNETGADMAVTEWKLGTGLDWEINDLKQNTNYYVITVLKEKYLENKNANGSLSLNKLEEDDFAVGDDLQTAVIPNGEFTNIGGQSVETRITAGDTYIRIRRPNPAYKYGLKKGSTVIYAYATPNSDGIYLFEGLECSTEYNVVAICEETGNNNCEPIPVTTLGEGEREEYDVEEDGVLPHGVKYGEIDYDIKFISQVIIHATDKNGKKLANSYINLTSEELVTDFEYNAYSRNGGKAWTKGELTNKKLQSLLNAGVSLVLCKGDPKDPESCEMISFETIERRPKTPTFKVNYLIYADPSGLTNGMWTLADRGEETQMDLLFIGLADSAGKNIGENGWGLFPEEDGVWVEDLGANGKVVKRSYLYKTAAHDNVPSSKPKTVKVESLGRPLNSKANYSYLYISISAGCTLFFGEEITDTRADKEKLFKSTDTMPFEQITGTLSAFEDFENKAYFNHTQNIKVDLSTYLTEERNSIIVWRQAKASAPASTKKTITLAARGSMKEVSFTAKMGKISLKEFADPYVVFDEARNVWASIVPKINENSIFRIRTKNKAKSGRENDTEFTWGTEGYLVVEYGVYSERYGYTGIVGAKTYLTLEEAEAALAALNEGKPADEDTDPEDTTPEETDPENTAPEEQ